MLCVINKWKIYNDSHGIDDRIVDHCLCAERRNEKRRKSCDIYAIQIANRFLFVLSICAMQRHHTKRSWCKPEKMRNRSNQGFGSLTYIDTHSSVCKHFVWLPSGSKLLMLMLLPTKEMFTCNFAYKTQFNGGSSQHQPNKLYIKWIKIWCETIINLNFSYRIRFKRKTAVHIQWNQATARQRRKSTTVEFIHTHSHIYMKRQSSKHKKTKQNTNTEIQKSMAKKSELNANVNKAFDTCAPNEC